MNVWMRMRRRNNRRGKDSYIGSEDSIIELLCVVLGEQRH